MLSPSAQALLETDPRVRLCYQFGSSVRDGAPAARDVDIAVYLGRPPSYAEEVTFRSELQARDPRVDLVFLDGAPVVLVHEVVTTGRCLVARDGREQAEFEIRAIARYQDFRPFLQVQWDYLRWRSEARRGASH